MLNNTSNVKGAFIHQPQEVENLLCLMLDIHINVETDYRNAAEKESDAEKESIDQLDFLRPSSCLSFYTNQQIFLDEQLHCAYSTHKVLYQEVSGPPPKA